MCVRERERERERERGGYVYVKMCVCVYEEGFCYRDAMWVRYTVSEKKSVCVRENV